MRYQVAPRMEMFSGLTYTNRQLPTRELSIHASSGQYGLSVLPADNPYNPFGVDVVVDFTYDVTGVFVSFDNTYLIPSLASLCDCFPVSHSYIFCSSFLVFFFFSFFFFF